MICLLKGWSCVENTICGWCSPAVCQAAAVLRSFEQLNKNVEKIMESLLVHTGQHYDFQMSGLF